MTGLFNLRTRLALSSALLIALALGTIYFLAQRLSADIVSADGNLAELQATESRVLGAIEQERERLRRQLYEVLYDEANTSQLRSGGGRELVLRLTITQEIDHAWFGDDSDRIVAQAGAGEPLTVLADTRQQVRRALNVGSSAGIVSGASVAAMLGAVRVNGMSPPTVMAGVRMLDQEFAQRLSSASGAQVGFLAVSRSGALSLFGASFEPVLEQLLLQRAVSTQHGEVQVARDLSQDGKMVRLSLIHQSDFGRIYAVMVPGIREIGVKMTEFLRLVGIVAALALALALAGGLIFGKRLSSALVDLTQAARQISNGRYDVEVKARSNDELGRFVESFNLLAKGLKQRESKMFQSAHRDAATGLPSRPLFENHLIEELNRVRKKGGKLALVLVMVDQLRDVSDSLGRKAADTLLAEVAERMRRVIKSRTSGGVFVARLGSYDFGIVLGDSDAEQAAAFASRLMDALARRIEFEGQSVLPGARLGLAVYPDHGLDPGSLLYSADIAASRAQSEISRVALFDPSFERDRERQLAMLTELQTALERGELHIALQPKIHLNGDGTLMAEALMRWEHPERGPQNPAEFVPFAEKTGFITKLTYWMIDNALDTAAQWLARGVPLTVSVNLSPRDLGSPDFTTYVVERLRAYKLRGSALTLEITEEAVARPTPIVRQNLDVLWRLGVKLAIDDFGSGFASLEQLRSLPLSYLKVDREYVRGLASDDASRIVVRSAIDLGHAIGVEVVAEGVETEEQLEILRTLSCDLVQGYFVGKPLNAADFEQWVRTRSASFGVQGADQLVSASSAQAVPGRPALPRHALDDELILEAPPMDFLSGESGDAPGAGGLSLVGESTPSKD